MLLDGKFFQKRGILQLPEAVGCLHSNVSLRGWGPISRVGRESPFSKESSSPPNLAGSGVRLTRVSLVNLPLIGWKRKSRTPCPQSHGATTAGRVLGSRLTLPLGTYLGSPFHKVSQIAPNRQQSKQKSSMSSYGTALWNLDVALMTRW
jgi:hypothetical protein